ncbi:hypothetical protein ABPG75_002602 [Micractinium tetrahymenae]
MLGLLSSQLAFSAATTLAKKTFEFSITSSLKGLSDVIHERFSHSQVLQDTQAELEAKVKMLCLPVDLLAHFATRGNTALQEPLGVALAVLEEVEAFRQALVQHDVARAQEGSSPEAATASAAQLCRRLRELIARLDSLLPYLNLAISTAVLLNQGSPSSVSYSRLMSASWHLRASPQPGAAVFALPEASWHEERRLTAAGPRMGEVFRHCRLTVLRSAGATATTPAAAADGAPASPLQGAAAAAVASPFGYELLIEQDLDDGLYHEPGECAAALRLQVADIAALEWETTQSLGQGENEYRPALVLHVWQSGGTAGAAWAAGEPLASTPAGAPADGGGLSTPPASSSRPASRARSKQGGKAAAEQAATATEPAPPPAAPAAAAAGGDAVTPVPAARAGSSAGVGGSLRRCAIILNPRHADSSSDSEDGAEGGGGTARDAADEDDDSDGSERGGRRPLGLPGGYGGQQPASAALQQQWQLLGELEYVLRLCALEWREQAPSHEITDERILLHFQSTSAPTSTHAYHSTAAPATLAGPHDAALQRRGSAAAAAAAQRWRSAAAGAAHAISGGVEALTQDVRQLSFTPGGSGHSGNAAAMAAVVIATTSEPEARGPEADGSASRRQTRSGSRAGGRGFGSPVQ